MRDYASLAGIHTVIVDSSSCRWRLKRQSTSVVPQRFNNVHVMSMHVRAACERAEMWVCDMQCHQDHFAVLQRERVVRLFDSYTGKNCRKQACASSRPIAVQSMRVCPFHLRLVWSVAERVSSLSKHSGQHRKLCLRDQYWPLGPGLASRVKTEATAWQARELV